MYARIKGSGSGNIPEHSLLAGAIRTEISRDPIKSLILGSELYKISYVAYMAVAANLL